MTSPYFQPPTYERSRVTEPAPDAPALPVVVVGAGPVGMSVALGLAHRGIPVTVLEAADQVSFGSRAICISRHSLEVADRLGFGEQLAALALEWQGGRSYHRDREVLHFTMPHEDGDVRAPMVNVSQSELEQMMVETLEKNPLITLHWGTPVVGVQQDDDGASVTIDTVEGQRTLRAQYVVAADGGRSAVRQQLGLRLEGTSYEGRYVIADIHWVCDLPAERLVWFDPPSNPGSTVIMHRQPNDIWRIDYQLAPGDDAEVETQEERIRERIAKHLTWLRHEQPWTLEWHGFYQARALALPDFVHGRVVFTGDAAHLVPIFGVRGLNSGMEDADTLVWTLSAVLRGDADPALLAAYSAERHDAWQQNVANAGKSTLVMTPGTDGYRATRDALLHLSEVRPEFSHLLDPRQSSATHARRSPLTLGAADDTGRRPGAGDPVPDRRVRTAAGKESSVHEVRGTGFGLYAFAPLDEAALEAVHRLRDDLASALPHEDARRRAGRPRGHRALAGRRGRRAGRRVGRRPRGGLRGPPRRAAAGPRSCRRPGGVPAHLRAGGTVRPQGAAVADPRVGLPPEQAAREQVWLTLSDALDTVEADARPDLLTRLALVLGDQVGPAALRDAVQAAGAAR